MRKRTYKYLVGDFETTVYKGQVNTEVWASACVELFTDEVVIHNSIAETFEYLKSLNTNVVIYYHNLKFDGMFWLSYLLCDLKFKQAYVDLDEKHKEWLNEKDMLNNTFKYSIAEQGMWYNIVIKVGGHFIEIRDSLKLLPFSVKKIGSSFGTKHKKLDMEYKGFRYAGCIITPEEKEYIANDVLVVKEALEIMFNEGHTALTIGACCLQEYKKIKGKDDYNMFFPDLYDIIIDKDTFGKATAGDYIRRSYKGGWCYLVKGKEGVIHTNGTTADVNSLYPSMMSSESGNRYPVGLPHFWKGDYIDEQALKPNRYYFVRVKTRFYIKPNYLPFVQIKSSFLYKGTECLETTDVLNPETGEYNTEYLGLDGKVHDTRVELTLTMTDFELLKEHYELVDFEILDGCWFFSEIGIFDEYIEKYKKIKLESTGAIKELAKLFLNNLYGKLASSQDSSFKLAFEKEDGSISFLPVHEENKKAGYIPCGSAITSYARNFTIRSAQKNYHGVGQRGFIYADTDSIHCDLQPEEIKGITVHDKNFCCWKLESQWDVAIFTRQKTYIEHITHEDCKPIEKPYNNIKCAGMPQKCKTLLDLSFNGVTITKEEGYTEQDIAFVNKKREYTDFKVGLKIHGKLRPKRIRGGVLLVDTDYEMR